MQYFVQDDQTHKPKVWDVFGRGSTEGPEKEQEEIEDHRVGKKDHKNCRRSLTD